jgi:hypothetical protein
MAQLGLTLAVLIVIGMLLGAVWLIRGRASFSWKAPWAARPREPRELRRLAGLVLTTHHTVQAVEWRGKGFLIATGPGGAILLDKDGGSFSSEFRGALSRVDESPTRGER